jgi:hypothetical protein
MKMFSETFFYKFDIFKWAQNCNSSYSGGRDQKDLCSKLALGKSFSRPYLKNSIMIYIYATSKDETENPASPVPSLLCPIPLPRDTLCTHFFWYLY